MTTKASNPCPYRKKPDPPPPPPEKRRMRSYRESLLDDVRRLERENQDLLNRIERIKECVVAYICRGLHDDGTHRDNGEEGALRKALGMDLP